MTDYYAPPRTVVDDVNRTESASDQASLQTMHQTRPWVLVVVATLLINVVISIIVVADAASGGEYFHGGERSSAFDLMSSLVGSAVNIVMYAVLGWLLFRYATGIQRFTQTATQDDLAGALREHRLFWKFSGFAVIIMMVLMMVLMVVGIMVAMATTAF